MWEIDSIVEDGAGGVHPTMKPLECFRRPIAYHTRPGELIYEPFAGSGTALIAAEQLGRVCYALELSPAFCDVIVARWERLTRQEGGASWLGRPPPRSRAASMPIYDLLLQGVGRRGIAQYAQNHGWQVSPRQLDTYAARAKRLLAAAGRARPRRRARQGDRAARPALHEGPRAPTIATGPSPSCASASPCWA